MRSGLAGAHTSNHQLHYDTDEQRLRRGAGVHCPAVSTVLYLDAGTDNCPLIPLQLRK